MDAPQPSEEIRDPTAVYERQETKLEQQTNEVSELEGVVQS